MSGLSGSELLLYGGICMMVAVILVGTSGMFFFRYKGRKLKEKLTREYGNLRQ